MNRLTSRFDGTACFEKYDKSVPLPCNGCGIRCSSCAFAVVLERLAKYEDTGFTPEEIQHLNNKEDLMMKESYMSQVAEMLGVEIGEEFEIMNEDGNTDDFNPYKITEEGLCNFMGAYCHQKLSYLLSGEYMVKKQPWKPIDGERCWFVNVDGTVSSYIFWKTNMCYLAMFDMGNYFQTEKEALEAREKMVKEFGEIQKEVEFGEKFDIVLKDGEDDIQISFKLSEGNLIQYKKELPDETLLSKTLRGDYIVLKRTWRPEDGGDFWYVTPTDRTCIGTFFKTNAHALAILKFGNCFETLESAEKSRDEILKKFNEIKKEVEE